MVATTAMAAVLALRYKSFAIAALGLAARYVTPLLLSTGEDHPWFLFSYLLLLNFAATNSRNAVDGRGWKSSALSRRLSSTAAGCWTRRSTQQAIGGHTCSSSFYAQRWLTQTPRALLFLATIYRFRYFLYLDTGTNALPPTSLTGSTGRLGVRPLPRLPPGHTHSVCRFLGFISGLHHQRSRTTHPILRGHLRLLSFPRLELVALSLSPHDTLHPCSSSLPSTDSLLRTLL